MKLPLRLICQRTSSRGKAVGTLFCLSMVILASTSGCSYYGNALCSAVAPYEQIKCDGFRELRGRVKARAIWAKKYANCYRKHCNLKDVRAGFIDGFVDSCMGGDGCPPMFAPNGGCSLGLGNHCASAWFEGYPLGAAAAEACGACRWAGNRCHPGLLSCGENPACNPGCEPCTNSGMCGSCGQAGATCGCNGSGPISHLPAPPMISDHDYSQDLRTTSPYDMPTVQPGETIVPGSIQTTPSSSGTETAAPEAAPALPTPDHSAQTEPAPLVEKSDVTQVETPSEGIVEMATPIEWSRLMSEGTPVAPVSFKTP